MPSSPPPPPARLQVPALMLALAVGPVTILPADGQEPPPGWPPDEEALLDWTDLQFPPDEYRSRRDRLMARIQEAGGGVVLVPSGDGTTHGQTFRQEDGFNYLVGLELPTSTLVLDADAGVATLYLPARDARFDNPERRNDFPGRRLGDDPAVGARAGVDALRDAAELDGALRRWEEAGTPVWVDGGAPGPVGSAEPGLHGGVEPTRALAMALERRYPALRIRNAYAPMARLRMVKSPAEVAVLRRAADATADAIRAAAKEVRPGVDERALEGAFEQACKRAGSQRLAFSSIIKSGPNSLWPWRVLAAHYDRRNRALASGELVIFDVGCEVDYYASDVGRTFPAGGSFTGEQRRVLEMVTAVSDAIIAAVRPGITLIELRELAIERIPEAERLHMQTGSFFGHHLGLAVGDPSLLEVPLEPGMTFTVEPWYYDHEGAIAVFVEDEVLVTADGAEVLTAGLPRDPDGLEALMR